MAEQSVASESKARKGLRWGIGIVLLLALAAASYWLWIYFSKVETTDDAQIDGTIYPISSRIQGHVVSVPAQDQKPVKQGDVLVELDKKDYEVAVAKAEAELADAEATLQSASTDVPIVTVTSSSNLASTRSGREDAAMAVSMSEQQVGAARARVTSAQANVRVAQANAAKAQQDVDRYKVLVAKDEISKQTYDQSVATEAAAQAEVDAQKAAVAEAEQMVAAALKATDQAKAKLRRAEAEAEGATTAPQQVSVSKAREQAAAAIVAQKRAELDQAKLNLSYTTIVAPVNGVVGKKTAEAGQNIAAGQPLMAVVALDDIWVTANFKETQLKDMKIGQTVTFELDATGKTYTGRIERISAASGSRFSLLPPENATGNYVKVVQRIPVRISIDPNQDPDHMLRVGMSLTPAVHIR
jgi:membrane fusion protein (multidrug efflux system)